jgi:hypothetical protein
LTGTDGTGKENNKQREKGENMRIIVWLSTTIVIVFILWTAFASADCPCVAGDIEPAAPGTIMQAKVNGVQDSVNYSIPVAATIVYYEMSTLDGGNKTFAFRIGVPWPELPGSYRWSAWNGEPGAEPPFVYALPSRAATVRAMRMVTEKQ